MADAADWLRHAIAADRIKIAQLESEADDLRGDAEIARLRLQAAHAEVERLRLTDAEREAICQAVTAYDGNDDDEQCAEIAATLRGLLERTK
jgi:hypothetical protein